MGKPPKAHHYIPQTYLRNFTNGAHRLAVLIKDKPEETFDLRPREVAHHKFYYSQPTHDGGLDHRLESMFSGIESHWPALVARLRLKEHLSPDELRDFITFMVSLRTRVPAARDAAELYLAESVRSLGRQMEANGDFPAPPEGLEEHLKFDNLKISIDPHRSLLLMVDAIRGLGPVVDMFGYTVIHNRTAVPYVTSDNPVVYFDPTTPPEELRPYTIDHSGPAMLFFPIASDLMLLGSTTYADHFKQHGLVFQDEDESPRVLKFNQMIARFGYRQVYCREASALKPLAEYSAMSPVPKFDRVPGMDGEFLVVRMVFGPRPDKPKWKTD